MAILNDIANLNPFKKEPIKFKQVMIGFLCWIYLIIFIHLLLSKSLFISSLLS